MKVNKKARFRKMLIIFAETTSDISDTNQTSDLTLSSSLNGWLVSTSCVCTNSTATITLTSLICHRNSSDYVCVSRSWRTNVTDCKRSAQLRSWSAIIMALCSGIYLQNRRSEFCVGWTLYHTQIHNLHKCSQASGGWGNYMLEEQYHRHTEWHQ